ncbi:MCPH1 protein, partial [Mionectes macconnelli]|nr:MCPH1 protein [Mionectes macconnelli]
VSAFVEVWSSNRTENYSKTFEQQLLDMGAKVSKTLNKHVTHVVFKDGRLTTWKKAQKLGVKTVSVLWVEKCQETGVHVDESLFPAVDTNEGFPLLIKKHKCMQPKDFVEKTPENDRKLQRRLDQMAKDLALQKTAINTETDIPVLLFEDNGSLIYSPVNKMKDQCNASARGMKDMKKEIDNLFPTGTQTVPSSSPEDCPLSTCVLTNSEDTFLSGEQMEDCLNSSYDYLWGTERLKRRKTEVVEHSCDIWTDTLVSTSASVNSPSQGNERKSSTPKRHTRSSLTNKQIIQHTLDDKLSLEKKQSKFPKKNQKNEKSKTTSITNERSSNTVTQVMKKTWRLLFSNDIGETRSHVVTGDPHRTLNIMLRIAHECWIFLWSLELGHWILEEPCELSSSFPAASICRLQRHLFSNQPVMFISPTSQPPCKKLTELLQLSGGKIRKASHQAKICIRKK